MGNQRRITPNTAQCCGAFERAVSHPLAARDRAISGAFDRDRRMIPSFPGSRMRRIAHWHRSLVLLAVGLLALAAPLIAMADGGGGPGPH